MEQNAEQIRQQCIFCQIADGRVNAKKVYEDNKFIGVLDINPANPGHILLIPKEHISIMPQMDDELIKKMGMVSKKLSQALLRALHVQGTTIFEANGSAAGQRAPHFMIHIIPRLEQDNVGLIPEMKKLNDEEIKQVEQAIYEPLKKTLGTAIKPKEAPKQELKKELVQKTSAGQSAINPELDSISNFLTK